MTGWARALALVAAVGAGVVAGILFAFSAFLMRAFDGLPAAWAIATMQAINRTIVTPPFLVVFAGSAVASGAAAVLLAVAGRGWAGAAAATALYVAGVLVVTGTANVPRNDRLDAVDLDDLDEPAARETWAAYRLPWTRWNHVRTLAATASCALLASAA